MKEMTVSKKASRSRMIELVQELTDRAAEDDIVVLARRSNARRLDQLKELDQEITVLEGLEASGKYDPQAIERAARIVAAEHAGIVQDIEIEMEALKKAIAENQE